LSPEAGEMVFALVIVTDDVDLRGHLTFSIEIQVI